MKWHTLYGGSKGGKWFLETSDGKQGKLTLYRRRKDNKYYIIDSDLDGLAFSQSEIISGPFDTLPGAKVAYLVVTQAQNLWAS